MKNEEDPVEQAPRFTPARLESLSLAADQFALHYFPAGMDKGTMHEIANALLEASKTAALLEQVSGILKQVTEYTARSAHVVNDEYLSTRLAGPSPGWCVECGAAQFNTRSGVTCPNGHGGAETLANPPKKWP